MTTTRPIPDPATRSIWLAQTPASSPPSSPRRTPTPTRGGTLRDRAGCAGIYPSSLDSWHSASRETQTASATGSTRSSSAPPATEDAGGTGDGLTAALPPAVRLTVCSRGKTRLTVVLDSNSTDDNPRGFLVAVFLDPENQAGSTPERLYTFEHHDFIVLES